MTSTPARYFYGWYHWFRALQQARAKRHGAGPMKWRYAIKMAGCCRYLVDGQHRKPPRFPRMFGIRAAKSNTPIPKAVKAGGDKER